MHRVVHLKKGTLDLAVHEESHADSGFLALAVAGLAHLWRRSGDASPPWARALRAALVVAVAASLVSTTALMIRAHPHQIAYFNAAVGGLSGARDRFQVGYWGAEYRETRPTFQPAGARWCGRGRWTVRRW